MLSSCTMAVKPLTLSEILLLMSLCGHLQPSVAQSNGDLRLADAKDDAPISTKGRLEIYLSGTWGTFCTNGFDITAASIACRQLGYADSYRFLNTADDPDIPLATDTTPIHVGRIDCPGLDCNTGNILHILRCPIKLDWAPPTCTHKTNVILECFLDPIDNTIMYDPYDTELFLNAEALNSTFSSSGVLEIWTNYNSNAEIYGWSNICGTKFDQGAANSACRQMGYSRAVSYSTNATRSNENTIWLNGVTCGDVTHPCLDSCFCYPRSPISDQCDSGKVVALTCTFDLDDSHGLFGTKKECAEKSKTICMPEAPTSTYNKGTA